MNDVFNVGGHVVAEVVETEFVVGSVGDVAGVGGLFVGWALAVRDDSDSEAHKFKKSAHPFGITSSEVIIDRYYEYSFASKGIEVSRHRTYKCFTFPSFHFGDVSLVHYDPTEELDVKRNHVPDFGLTSYLPLFPYKSAASVFDEGESFWQEVVEGALEFFFIFDAFKTCFEFRSFLRNVFIR